MSRPTAEPPQVLASPVRVADPLDAVLEAFSRDAPAPREGGVDDAFVEPLASSDFEVPRSPSPTVVTPRRRFRSQLRSFSAPILAAAVLWLLWNFHPRRVEVVEQVECGPAQPDAHAAENPVQPALVTLPAMPPQLARSQDGAEALKPGARNDAPSRPQRAQANERGGQPVQPEPPPPEQDLDNRPMPLDIEKLERNL